MCGIRILYFGNIETACNEGVLDNCENKEKMKEKKN